MVLVPVAVPGSKLGLVILSEDPTGLHARRFAFLYECKIVECRVWCPAQPAIVSGMWSWAEGGMGDA